MVHYEGWYAVDTVFDGSKLGIEPQAVQISPVVFDGSKLGIELHAVEITPAGDLLVLESINNNIYRVQLAAAVTMCACSASSQPLPFSVFLGFSLMS